MTLPEIALNLTTNFWWNVKFQIASKDISVLGLFPPGTHVFSGGVYETNAPAGMGPVQGGAPSGWVGQSQRLTPLQVKQWHGHYTPSSVIYLRSPSLSSTNRLAIRLRDDQGRYWLAKPETQGTRDGIAPYLVECPAEVKTVTPEIMVLNPIGADFLVDTKAEIGR